nr:G2/mitotic-specific cyclin-B-like [Leptinotarsa decemlineata]
MEGKYPIQKGFLDDHEITPQMRAILVDWLVEIHFHFNMHQETLHLCVSIVDRYLQETKVMERDVFQLVGASALLVAAKYERTYIPRVYEFKFLCASLYSSAQILHMEKDILKKLDFRLGYPLSIHYLRSCGKIAGMQSIHHVLAEYLLELALMKYGMSHVKPSLQASAACCLSMGILDDVMNLSNLWTSTLIYYTGYDYAELEDAIVGFANILVEDHSPSLQSVRKKYAGSNCANISLNPLLKGTLVKKLANRTSNSWLW